VNKIILENYVRGVSSGCENQRNQTNYNYIGKFSIAKNEMDKQIFFDK